MKKIKRQLTRKRAREYNIVVSIVVKRTTIVVQSQREPTRGRKEFRLIIECDNSRKTTEKFT